MAVGRGLPPDGSPGYATDWKTGQTTSEPVFREGKWWERRHYEHHQMAIRDRQRLKDNREFRTWLSGQPTDPGL